jgi:hypothetical protein
MKGSILLGTAAIIAVAAAAASAAGADVSPARTTNTGTVRAAPQAVATRAVLSYDRIRRGARTLRLVNPRVRISRRGRQVFTEAAPVHPRGKRLGYEPRPSLGHPASLVTRDLDGDDEPEVTLQLMWAGAHCCYWSRVYRFDSSRDTYLAVNHFWGNDVAIPSLKDIEGDGQPEFVSRDDRFAELTDYTNVVEPIQLWAYRRGAFRDVTQSYPARIGQDAGRLWRLYLTRRGRRSVRYILAAWAAEQYLLGRGAAVEQTLAEALRRGYLEPRAADTPRDPAAYVRMLKTFLRKTGYIG